MCVSFLCMEEKTLSFNTYQHLQKLLIVDHTVTVPISLLDHCIQLALG